MSKNVNVNGVDYAGVSQIQLNTTDGATALFKDVDEITEGGGGFDIDTAETLLCTVENEDAFANIINNLSIKPKYNNELCVMIVRGQNAPTQGTHTLRTVVWYVAGSASQAFENRGYNTLVAPNSVKMLSGLGTEQNNGNITSIAGSYAKLDSDCFWFHHNFGYYIAGGNTIHIYEVPFDITTPTIDTTLRAAE